MSNKQLPADVQARICKEALNAASGIGDQYRQDGVYHGYIAGATAENDRAKGLVDALEELVQLEKIKDELGETTNYLTRQPQAWKRAKEELAKWKREVEGEGEVPQEICGICKEKPVGKDITVCNDCYDSFDGDRRGFWKGDVYQ